MTTMKNLKKLLFVANLLLISSFVNAQYLVSATEIANRNTSQVQNYLYNLGYNTSQMTLNGVISYKITYNTVDVHEEPTIASGALMVPQIDCDTLPLVSYQHGTRFDKQDVPSNNMGPEDGLIYSGNGFIAALPDYLGMGENPGVHPYVHWESEATASIDLIRAAREFLNETLDILDNDQLFLAGYSQGGHATMALHKYITINNLQSEFNVVGSAPMSGPYAMSSDQYDLIINEDSTYAVPYYLPYAFASYQLVYENLYTNYNEYYDPPYDASIAAWIEDGMGITLPTNLYHFMQDTVLDNMKNSPYHPIRVDLRDNDLHNWIPQEPVRMLFCGSDVWVAPQNSITALDTMNALGATDVHAIDVYPAGTHPTCKIPAMTYSMEWFDSLRVECGLVTGLTIAEKQPEISIYPNPVKDLATFSSDEITSFELYDIMGKIIIGQVGNKVDMTNLNPGIYFVIGFDKHKHALHKGKIIKK